MSTEGTVEQIAIAAKRPELPAPVPAVRAEAGHGLEGEYHWSTEPDPGQSITLIAAFDCPPSFMCSGVSVITATIVAWLIIMASTARRAAGWARMSRIDSVNRSSLTS